MTEFLNAKFTVGALPTSAYRDGWEACFGKKACSCNAHGPDMDCPEHGANLKKTLSKRKDK